MQADIAADKPWLSVIIPALNEREALPKLLEDLCRQQDMRLEIIVVDGGSCDGSIAVPTRFGARLIRSERGRARQMNAGAGQAGHPLMLFLHADSRLPEPWTLRRAVARWIAEQQQRREHIAGHFPLRFISDHDRDYGFLEAKSASGRPQTINGDQGLLIHRDFFQELGGFDESFPWLEDQQIAQSIRERGQWLTLPGRLQTSARRFETEGFARRYLLMGLMMTFYWTRTPQFFYRAKQIYPAQQDTRQLQLWPYFRAIWQLLRQDLGLRGSLRFFLRAGGYARQQLWQLFFWADYRLGRAPRTAPATQFYDDHIDGWLDNRLADFLAALLVVPFYLLVIGPSCWLLESGWRSETDPERLS